MCRVGGIRRSLGASQDGGADETPPFLGRTTNTRKGGQR